MKHVFRQVPNLTTPQRHGAVFFNPKNRQHASRWWFLFLVLTSFSTLSWGQQCFNTSTVSLGYTTNPTSESPVVEAVADFNGDGRLDLAVVSNMGVNILLNTGNGTFGPTVNFSVGSQPSEIVAADFNGDGKPDLAVANYGSNNVSILLGTGSGSFGAAINIAVGTNPVGIAVGDFNGDSKADLSVTNAGSNNVSVLLGNGSGGFGVATNFATGDTPKAIVVGDFNGDSKADLSVANAGSDNVSVLLGTGTGGFGPASNLPLGMNSKPQVMATGDFNSDGKPDLAVIGAGISTTPIFILLGNGVGGFGMVIPPIALSFGSIGLTVGDFNGDGKADLATADFLTTYVSVLLGNGDGSFGVPTKFTAGAKTVNITTADFNGDGKLDLVTANQFNNNISVLLGKGDGTFGMAGAVVRPLSVAVADFNKDGKPDMAVASFTSNNVSVLLNNGSGGFGAATVFMAGSSPTSVAVGDFNKDGNPDLAVTNVSADNISILLGTGSGNFGMAPNVPLQASSKPQTVAVGDVNGDGNPDLVTANTGSGALSDYSIALGDGNGSFGAAKNFSAGYSYFSIAVGDFNGDAYTDFVTTDFIHSRVAVFVSNGTGDISSYQNFGVGDTPISVAVGDFNADGKADLATANLNSNNVSILLGAGNGTFGVATNYPANSNPYSIVSGDFNGDGKLDLAVTNNSSDKVSVLAGTGNGSFGAAASFSIGDGPISAAVGDFNGDGKPDLVTANSDSNDASLLLNCTATANTPPTVANAIPNQTGTVGTAFNYTIPANTFTDTETPGSLVLSASGLPAGLSLTGSTISGTPSTSGVSTVTIKATDPGGLFANASFTLTINPAGSPPPSGPFSITGVTTVSCTTLSAGERNLTFNPQYTGVNGQPISFSVVNEMVPTTSPGPYSLNVYTDNPVITLSAVQSGVGSTFVYNWLVACSGGMPPANTPPTVANAIPNQSGTVGTAFNYTIPANTFTDAETPGSLVLSASGLPAGLSLTGSTISGTPSASGVSTVTIKATDPGSLSVSTSFMFTINPAGSPPPTGFAITGVTTVNCIVLSAGERTLIFNPQYAGVNGQPISFSVANEMVPTTSPGPYSLHLYTDNPVITLSAVQSGVSSTFVYNWLAACSGGAPRIAAEPVAGFRVKVLGNPVRDAVEVEVSGAETGSLHLSLTDGMGRIIGESHTDRAGVSEHYRFDVSQQPAGALLLRTSMPGHAETVRVLKVN